METATLLNAIIAGIKAATDGLEQFQRPPDQADLVVKDGAKSDDPLATVRNAFGKAAGR